MTDATRRERQRKATQRWMANPVNRQRHREWCRRYRRWKAARRGLPEAIAYFESVGRLDIADPARELLAAIDEYRPRRRRSGAHS